MNLEDQLAALNPQPGERFSPVIGYEGLYEVSDQGRVRSLTHIINGPYGVSRIRPGRILKPSWTTGYASVVLCRNGTRQPRKVHALMLEAFVGPRPEGMSACHGDDDATNNTLGNLRWDTHDANMADKVRNGRTRNGNAGKPECKRGHSFTPENVYVDTRGSRRCRACRQLSRKAALA